MSECSKAPDSRRYLLLSCWGFWSPHGGVGSNPTSHKGSFIIGSVFETVNIIVSIFYFAIWPIQIFNILVLEVRMAEWSKAPDSRSYFLLSRWGFWSPHGGVGSNPTSDTSSFWIGSIFETVNIIVSIVCFAIWPMQIFNILVLECQNGHSAITPNSRRYLLLSCWGFWSPHGGVGSNPTSDEVSFIIGSVFETVNNIVSIIYFAIWPMPMIELSLISLCQQVRMAKQSKAPDSRHCQLLSCWGFWSPHGGVGSNPTSDTSSFCIGSVFETVNNIVSIIYFAIWPMPMIELSLISLCQQVRMAEQSKAPDSRHCQLLSCWGFWSPHGGVGSNPTSDTSSFCIGSVFETVNIIHSMFILPSDQCKSLTSLHWNVRMAEWSKAPDSGVISFSVVEVYGLHMEAWVQIPLLTEALFELEAFWDRKHYSLYCLFCHLTNANDEIVFNILVSTSQNGRAV